MLYILDQRLRAQAIPDEKAKKGKSKSELFSGCKTWRLPPETQTSFTFKLILLLSPLDFHIYAPFIS